MLNDLSMLIDRSNSAAIRLLTAVLSRNEFIVSDSVIWRSNLSFR